MGRTLCYWDIRGLAMPIRFLLAYLDVDYEDKRYNLTQPPHSRDEWLAEKHNLGLDFPNLPYWKDGDVEMTESRAIVRHVARVHDPTATLLPSDPKIAYKADMLENLIFDALMGLAMFAFEYDPVKEDEVSKGLHEKLEAISNYLGSNKWITGDAITFADFWLYETLIWFTRFNENFLDPYANFAGFTKRFEDLPSIKKYINGTDYMQGPCISPIATKKI